MLLHQIVLQPMLTPFFQLSANKKGQRGPKTTFFPQGCAYYGDVLEKNGHAITRKEMRQKHAIARILCLASPTDGPFNF